MKRTRYHFTIRSGHQTLSGAAVSRVAETEDSARQSILKIVREAASDAELVPARRCMEDRPKLTDR